MPPARVVRRNHQYDIAKILQRRRHAVYFASIAAVFCIDMPLERPIPIPMHTISGLTGQVWLNGLLNDHPDRSLYQLGMYPAAFLLLCWELTTNGGLADSRGISAMEQVAIVVYWLVHGSSQRELMERFQRSGDTISKYTHHVLNTLVGHFYDKYIQDPADETPSKIANNSRYFPFFRYCRGAVDGVHVPAYALADDVIRYRDRHGNISQNVLAASDFDMRFTYTMPGYEGTAADGRLFDTGRRNGFALSDHCYYLADAGFPNCDMLMAPILGVRYHLSEWHKCGKDPETPEELFNHIHALLRNVIERIFGVVKRRFRILTAAPEHSYTVQSKIVAACAALHNFLRIHDALNTFEVDFEDGEEYDPNNHPFLTNAAVTPERRVLAITTAESTRADARRHAIMQNMWDHYLAGLDDD